MSAASVEATKLISNIFSCISRGIGFTIIVFLTAQYFKPKSNHKSAYYVILNIGYVMDFILFINWLIPFSTNVYYFTLITLDWYTIYFTTIWNVILCVNRCTALAFLMKYDRIWTSFTMFFVIIIMLIFPFIVDGYSLFGAGCTVDDFRACLSFRTKYYLTGTIVNASLNGISILLIALALFKASKDQYKAHSTHAKTERRLIYQAIFSSVFQLLSFALKYATATNADLNIYLTFMYFSNIVWHFHHLAVMATHFILSPTFKMAFFEFYRLKFLIPSLKNQTKSVSHRSTHNITTRASIRPISIIAVT